MAGRRREDRGENEDLSAHRGTLARTCLTGGEARDRLEKPRPPLEEPKLSKTPSKNDLDSAVPKFCFGLEAHRRTPDGRTRSPQEFLAHFFPHDSKSATDRIFRHMPRHVRAPILTTWGVRGRKSALMDDDSKVQSVVHDALVAGDIDANMFEEALAPDTIMRWVDLADWWTFWRGGKITKFTISKVLESAYALGLFDAAWFLETLRGGGGKLRGTDVLAEGLTKADLTDWIRSVHEGADASPKGLVAALGWDQIVLKTEDDVLVAVFDAMAVKISLAPEPVTKVPEKPEPKQETKPDGGAATTAQVEAKADVKAEGKPEVKAEAKPDVKIETKVEAKVEAKPEAKPDLKTETKSEAKIDPKADPKGVAAKPDAKTEAGAAKVESGPAQAAAPKEAGKAEAPGPAGPALPGILITATAVRSEGAEQSIDSEAAASLFKDDELIPISSGTWEDGDDPPAENGSSDHAARSPKPPQAKRASKNPPARGSK